MEKLLRGVSIFIRRWRPALRATFKRLAQGQNPIALLLACSDSRVVPGLLLSADPGDIFEVRTVGNIIAPADAAGETAMGDESEAAAIEYALIALNVRHIVVMGHSSCGAMAKVLSGHSLEGARSLERWLVHARGASGGSRGESVGPRGPSRFSFHPESGSLGAAGQPAGAAAAAGGSVEQPRLPCTRREARQKLPSAGNFNSPGRLMLKFSVPLPTRRDPAQVIPWRIRELHLAPGWYRRIQ